MSKLTTAPWANLGEFPGPSKPWFSYLKGDKAGIEAAPAENNRDNR